MVTLPLLGISDNDKAVIIFFSKPPQGGLLGTLTLDHKDVSCSEPCIDFHSKADHLTEMGHIDSAQVQSPRCRVRLNL